MVLKYEDDTNGEQYTAQEIREEGIIGGEPELFSAGVSIHGPFDRVDFHPEHADYDELRRLLHDMVDRAVDAYENHPEADD